MSKKPIVNAESSFDVEEMFISITDKKGIIESGNAVFVRVSGYERSKLIGAPHNIIRHPDMPKAVFKLLWETISADKPIVAYVKNRALDGRYYWVLASVMPTKSGYFSIRIKPTSPILGIVEELYVKMVREEAKVGVEASTALLLDALKGLGFGSYTEFYRKALVTELNSRSKIISERPSGNPSSQKNIGCSIFEEMKALCASTGLGFSEAIAQLTRYSQIDSFFEEKTQAIIKACDRLEYLSLNMSVTANKFGKEGASLATVSTAFQRAAKQIAERFSGLGVESRKVADFIFEATTDLELARLQIQMLEFYSNEVLISAVDEYENNAQQEARVLIAATRESFEKALQNQAVGLQGLKHFKALTDSLKNTVMSLDLIRLGGRLEGSRQVQTEEAFNPYVEEMQRFILAVEGPIQEMAGKSLDLIDSFGRVHAELSRVALLTVKLEMLQYRKKNNQDQPSL